MDQITAPPKPRASQRAMRNARDEIIALLRQAGWYRYHGFIQHKTHSQKFSSWDDLIMWLFQQEEQQNV